MSSGGYTMRKKASLRAGIVGAGFSAAFHYEAVRKVYGVDVDVAGVYALDKAQAQAYADKRGIRCYDSLDALLNDVDVIHCCVLVAGHEEVTVAALRRDKSVILEKPMTGYCGDGSEAFHGDTFPKEDALQYGLASVERMLMEEEKSKGRILYAENWVYAPSVQKEREIIEKTGAQVSALRIDHDPARRRSLVHGNDVAVLYGYALPLLDLVGEDIYDPAVRDDGVGW